MESMVSEVPSAWLTMEAALGALSNLLILLYVLTLLLIGISLANLARAGVLDLTWALAAVVILAIRELRRFCVGAMGRLRQLGELV